jgi:hypothetical protein
MAWVMPRLLQDAHEGGAVDRVARKAPSITPRVVQRAQRARRQVLRPGVLVEQKGLQDGVRVALVQVVAGHLDQAALSRKRSLMGRRVCGGSGAPRC